MKRRTKVPSIIFILVLIISIISLDIYRQNKFRTNDEVTTLSILYTSEKEGWINSIASEFPVWYENRNEGLQVELQFEILGTRSSMISILSGESKPAIWSPASKVWVPLFDWSWKRKFGSSIVNQDEVKSLVASPIVIGAWESYALNNNFSSWSDLYELAQNELKLAHTSAQESNSGYMAVLLEVAAAVQKKPSNITIDDLKNETVQNWLETVESKAVLYGSSTGFLAKQAVQLGPSGLNVMILYENLIIETAKDGEAYAKWNDNIIAIYPQEGTLWSDHPIVRLNASWVTEDEVYAAKEFQEFLLSKDIQKKAIPFGFRPGNDTLLNDSDIIAEMESIFSEEYGVRLDPNIPKFEAPTDGEVLDRIPDLWIKTRATSLKHEQNQEYWQVGYESYAIFPLLFLAILVISLKKRKRIE